MHYEVEQAGPDHEHGPGVGTLRATKATPSASSTCSSRGCSIDRWASPAPDISRPAWARHRPLN